MQQINWKIGHNLVPAECTKEMRKKKLKENIKTNKNMTNESSRNLKKSTTAHPWCGSHFTSINACRVWG